jgi:3-hydroxybutyryl-CoA dehydratase
MSFPDSHLFFDDVEVGQEWVSLGRTVTETDIVNFAGLSGDYNPIHVDAAFCQNTPFRQRIAHGLLVFSIGSGLSVSAPPVRTLAFLSVRDWQFKGPVFIGDTIRMKTKVLEKHSRGRGRRGEVVWYRAVVNQEDRVVQEGISVTLVEAKAGARNPAPAVVVAPANNGTHPSTNGTGH